MSSTGSEVGVTPPRILEIRLADGQSVDARVDDGGAASGEALLEALHTRLGMEPYVHLGDTVVRSEDVRLVRLKDAGDNRPGLLGSLLPGRGGEDMATTPTDRTETETMRMETRGIGMRGQRGWMDRPRSDETKEFFWTSEFLAAVLGVTAVAICAAVFDNLDVERGLILITALLGAYILSRGIAKAGTPDRERGRDA